MESADVNLDNLNEKQRSKEFKSAAKEIKSKDPAVRSKALSKLKDARYLTLGPCFASIFDSLTPKKKLLDLSRLSIDALLSFLGDVKFIGCLKANDLRSALHMLVETAGSCNHLQVLTDLIVFKEEVKKVKVKKGETPPPVIESEDVIYLRRRAIEAVCGLVTLLSSPNAEDKSLQKALAAIPSFTYNLCTTIMWLADRYRDESEREGMLQEAIWALASLAYVLRHNPLSAQILLSFELGDVVKCISDMAGEKCLSLFCLEIFELLSRVPSGLQKITEDEFVARLIGIVEASSDTLCQLAVPTNSGSPRGVAAGAGAGGKAAPKKEEKPKKGGKTPAAETADSTDKRLIADPKRLLLAYLKLLADSFTAISRFNADIITVDISSRLVTSFSKVLLNNAAWEVARGPPESPFSVPLNDTFVRIAILFGSIGTTNSPQRKAAVNAGAARTMFTVLQQSRAVVSGENSHTSSSSSSSSSSPGALSEEAGLNALRRVAEQAILRLLTKSIDEVTQVEETKGGDEASSDRITARQRWLSASSKFVTKRFEHHSAADAADESDSSQSPFSVPQLLEIIASAGDLDLGTRGIRILAALLQGVEDLPSFLHELNLDAAAVGTICTAVQTRGAALLSALDKETAAAAQAAATAEGVDVSPASATVAGESIDLLKNQEVAVESAADDLLLPDEREALYVTLTVLEPLLNSSTANINIFTTKERLMTFSSLLYRCGPSGNSSHFLAESNEAAADATTAAAIKRPNVEVEVSLYDPRSFSNLATIGESESDRVLLRPLLFDILAIVASADAKNRKYEGEVPPEPSKPLPSSTSPCGDAPVAVSKICGDACIAALSYGTSFAVVEGNVTTVPAAVTLHTQVLDSAIGLLIGMASCGASGLYGILECVSDAGFRGGDLKASSGSGSEGALQGLKEFLLKVISRSVEQESESSSGDDGSSSSSSAVTLQEVEQFKKLLAGPFTWTRTLLFDQLFPDESSILTAKRQLLTNPLVWPYVCVCAAILAVIASPDSNNQTAALAMDAIELLCRVPMFPNEGQPVIVDIFSAIMLSLGGGIHITGALGRFGALEPRSKESAASFANYLIARGRLREEFWAERARKLAADSAPVDGKGSKKKDDKKKEEKKKETKKDPKKDPQAAAAASQVGMSVAEVQYNLEPDASHPDPNHGPNRSYWTRLLSIAANDLHALTTSSTALTTAIQGGASEIAVNLINEHAAINKVDGKGLAPLMYAFILSNELVASSLIAARADLDVLDAAGNPALKYACLTLSPEDIESTFVGHLTIPKSSAKATLLGGTALLNLLLEARVDTLVTDKAGNSPLLWCLGLGVLAVELGGYPLTVTNVSYSSEYPRSSTYVSIDSLIRCGASVNACNRQGVVPLHVAAARGDIDVINLLQQSGAKANAADTSGFLPLHYTAAACPPDAPAVFDFLISFARERPVEQMSFDDTRTGLSSSDKYDQDVTEILRRSFEDCLSPAIITMQRKQELELMSVTSNDGLNVLQLCMAAHALQLDRFSSFISGGKFERMELALHLYSKHEGEKANLFRNIDSYGMSALHAASLLFEGSTPRVELTAQEKRSKRVKKYPSAELHILDIIFTTTRYDVDGVCTRPVPTKKIPRKFPWTPLHGAISSNNKDLVSELVRVKKSDISHFPYIHFMAERDVESHICDFIIGAAAVTSGYNVLLNAPASGGATPMFGRPLHIAVRSRNIACISGLVHCARVNPNVVDEASGKTPFHEACCSGDIELIKTFSPASDRLDLHVTDRDGRTCVEAALEASGSSAIEIISILLDMRRNDVLGRLTATKSSSGEGAAATSILKQLEERNISLVKTLGLDRPPQRLVEVSSSSVVDVQVEALAEKLGESSLQNKESQDPQGKGHEPLVIDAPEEVHEAHSESKAADGTEDQPLEDAFESLNLTKDAGEGEGTIAESTPGEVQQQEAEAGAIQLSDADREAADVALSQSDDLLRVLLPVLVKAGLTDDSLHAHPCFAKGVLYRDFCNPVKCSS